MTLDFKYTNPDGRWLARTQIVFYADASHLHAAIVWHLWEVKATFSDAAAREAAAALTAADVTGKVREMFNDYGQNYFPYMGCTDFIPVTVRRFLHELAGVTLVRLWPELADDVSRLPEDIEQGKTRSG